MAIYETRVNGVGVCLVKEKERGYFNITAVGSCADSDGKIPLEKLPDLILALEMLKECIKPNA